jgi:hypothetical protein
MTEIMTRNRHTLHGMKRVHASKNIHLLVIRQMKLTNGFGGWKPLRGLGGWKRNHLLRTSCVKAQNVPRLLGTKVLASTPHQLMKRTSRGIKCESGKFPMFGNASSN